MTLQRRRLYTITGHASVEILIVRHYKIQQTLPRAVVELLSRNIEHVIVLEEPRTQRVGIAEKVAVRTAVEFVVETLVEVALTPWRGTRIRRGGELCRRGSQLLEVGAGK